MNETWCGWSYQPSRKCPDHGEGEPHSNIVSPLGPGDEPRQNGALVIVWPGNYRRQETWTASGANIGNWYCLGNEFGRPRIWQPPTNPIIDLLPHRGPVPQCPPGMVPLHPDWSDVLKRGPVFLLSHDNVTAYRTGWRNGRPRPSPPTGNSGTP
jgi:hypothetical protein